MAKILAFNWKMNPATLGEAIKLAKTSDYRNAIIIPPFIFIEEIAKILKNAKLGAQNLSWENKGAFTGEVSAIELKSFGVEYVIIGHSERRKYLKETDEMINKKVLTALKAGLKIILCVGEDLIVRKKGKKTVENFIENQLQKDLKGLSKVRGQMSNVIVAYEPVWSIGAGQADTSGDAAEIISFIKKSLVISHKLLIKVLYGGSVSGKNIKDFIQYKNIDGFLVGGASLKIGEIKKIIQIMK